MNDSAGNELSMASRVVLMVGSVFVTGFTALIVAQGGGRHTWLLVTLGAIVWALSFGVTFVYFSDHSSHSIPKDKRRKVRSLWWWERSSLGRCVWLVPGSFSWAWRDPARALDGRLPRLRPTRARFLRGAFRALDEGVVVIFGCLFIGWIQKFLCRTVVLKLKCPRSVAFSSAVSRQRHGGFRILALFVQDDFWAVPRSRIFGGWPTSAQDQLSTG